MVRWYAGTHLCDRTHPFILDTLHLNLKAIFPSVAIVTEFVLLDIRETLVKR